MTSTRSHLITVTQKNAMLLERLCSFRSELDSAPAVRTVSGNAPSTRLAPAASDQVLIADTTLRDEYLIARAPRLASNRAGDGVWRKRALSGNDLLALARVLADLPVDVIEAGFGDRPEEGAALSAVASQFKEAGPIVSGIVKISADPRRLSAVAEAVSCAARGRVHLFVDASEVLAAGRRGHSARLVEQVVAAIERVRGYVDDVEFSPPRALPEGAAEAAAWAQVAVDAGARTINVRSAEGSADPQSYLAVLNEFQALKASSEVVLSADPFVSDLRDTEALNAATRCAEVALEAGCRQVKCAFHGVAGTPGHPSLELLAFRTWLRNHLSQSPLWTNLDTTRLLRASSAVAGAKGFDLPPSQPLLGKDTIEPCPADFPEDPVERALTATATRIVFEGLGIEAPAWLEDFADWTPVD